MKPIKFGNIAKTVANVASSPNPGQAAGKLAAGALSVAHPIIGAVAGKAVARGTEAVVNKGIDFAKNPENQARAKEMGAQALGATSRTFRQLGTAGARKLGEFKSQIR